jgi:hypothetical protein
MYSELIATRTSPTETTAAEIQVTETETPAAA